MPSRVRRFRSKAIARTLSSVTSEIEFCCHLHNAWIPGAKNSPEIRVGERCCGVEEVRVIQCVEYFPSKLEAPAFVDLNLLEQAGIKIRKAGTRQDIAARVAERPQSRQREGRRCIEEVRYLAGIGTVVIGPNRSDQIRTVETDPGKASVDACRYVKRVSGLQRQYAVQLPSREQSAPEARCAAEHGDCPNRGGDETVLDMEVRQSFVSVPIERIRSLIPQAAVAIVRRQV